MGSLEEIFEHASQLPEDRRESYLVDACGEDTQLLAKLRLLIAAADEANDFFNLPKIAGGARRWTGEPELEAERLDRLIPGIEMIEPIGRGGMGAVYKARQVDLDRIVAIKILRPDMARSPGFAERFRREARAMAKLDHPNIVTVHDFGQTGCGLFYIVMAYVDGATLAQMMASGALSPEEALVLIPQLCEALQFAHDRGIVHRDIKPGNILLSTDGQVKVTDFGIAKLYGPDEQDPQLTWVGVAIGTPDYMAPEQISNSGDVDHRADIFSLGVVFYQMLTGELPKCVPDPPSEMGGGDTRLDGIVLKAMQKEAGEPLPAGQ